MNKIELIQSLIKKVENLKLLDEKELDSLFREARMITIKIYGEENDYIKQLEKIKSKAMLFGIHSGTTDYKIQKMTMDDWNGRISKYKNLFNTILKDITISNNSENLKENNFLIRLEHLLLKFHQVAKQLKNEKRRSGRTNFIIEDEYDVQYLLNALFKIEFDDVRKEEYTPSYAGGNSRIDFLLKKEQIIIEVKKTRNNLKDKEIGDQLLIDIGRYKDHPDCKMLYCFVYDPDELLSNPTGLEHDLSEERENFIIKVLIVPKK